MTATDEPRPVTVDDVVLELTRLLPTGIRPAALLSRPGLLRLRVVEAMAPRGDEYARAFVAEAVLRQAISALGDGPYGRAAAALFGATSGTRGLRLRDRRRLAGEELNDVLPSTFRRNYEERILTDVALELWRLSTTTT